MSSADLSAATTEAPRLGMINFSPTGYRGTAIRQVLSVTISGALSPTDKVETRYSRGYRQFLRHLANSIVRNHGRVGLAGAAKTSRHLPEKFHEAVRRCIVGNGPNRHLSQQMVHFTQGILSNARIRIIRG